MPHSFDGNPQNQVEEGWQIVVSTCAAYEQVAQLSANMYKRLKLKPLFITDRRLNTKMAQIVIEDPVWSRRLSRALETLDSKYVVLMLDDYFLESGWSNSILGEAVHFLSNTNGAYARLVNIPRLPTENRFNKISSHQRYGINLQPAVWNRQFLISVLQKSESGPWSTEISIARRFAVDSAGFYVGAFLMNADITVYNGVVQGRWRRSFKKRLHTLFPVDSLRELPEMTLAQNCTYELKAAGFRFLRQSKLRRIVKLCLKGLGVNFQSED